MPRPRSWTDDELRGAALSCGTLIDVCHHLGLTAGGQTYVALRSAMDRLGLKLAPASSKPGVTRSSRSWTDDQLRDAIQQSRSLKDACIRLGLKPGARRNENLRRHIARLGIESSHLPESEAPTRLVRSWTTDELRVAVRDSRSVAEVLRRLGYTPNGGMHRYIKAQIRMDGLDTSHFLGQSWSRGRSFPQGQRARPLQEILVEGSTYSSGALRKRLIAAGLKQARCEACGITEWRGERLTLELDHINGEPTDNRLENLRILCPNCHSQTDTWCRSTTPNDIGRRAEGT